MVIGTSAHLMDSGPALQSKIASLCTRKSNNLKIFLATKTSGPVETFGNCTLPTTLKGNRHGKFFLLLLAFSACYNFSIIGQAG